MKSIWETLINLVEEYEQLDLKSTIDFEKFNMYSLVYNSTALEGSTLTELETQLLIEEGITAKDKPFEHHLMVNDNHNALSKVIHLANNKIDISPEFLKSINALNMKNTGQIVNSALGTSDGTLGEFRLVQAYSEALGYYLNPTKIQQAVTQYCDEINKRLKTNNSIEEAYQLSFDAHFNLVFIHPWSDGNKRTSRLIMNFIQQYNNIPLSKVYVDDSNNYLIALKTAREQSNIDVFREFMATQVIRFLNEKIIEFKKHQDQSKSSGITFLF